MIRHATLAALLVSGLAAPGPSAAGAGQETVSIPPGARIRLPLEPRWLDRLQHNSGITLQWIGWERRGRLEVRPAASGYELHGIQEARDGPGRLTLDGRLVGITDRYFILRGRIVITDTPDRGRNCVREGEFEFRITGRRRYWRLQQMEACDGLTDYVDIYL